MFSLIICSTTPDLEQKLEQNIQDTIGCEYEFIIINNSTNKYSIFEAYNLGVERSKYPICCFMHQDILFHTQNWGQKVIEHFKDDQVGMIGIAGTKYLLKTPSTWNTMLHSQEINIIQHEVDTIEHRCNTIIDSEVIAVDGVWFCIKKEIFSLIAFDETFKGFHFYDLDISLKVLSIQKKILVVKNILIEHFSIGSINNNWFENGICFYEKWANHLPKIVSGQKVLKNNRYEEQALKKLWGLIAMQKSYNFSFDALKISIKVLGLKFVPFLILNFRLIFHNLRKNATLHYYHQF